MRVDQIRALKLSLTAAYHHGYSDGDFLPRRIVARKEQEQMAFDQLIRRVNRLVSSNLDSKVIPFSPDDDFFTLMRIRVLIRYIRNAFAGELTLQNHNLIA